MKFQVETKYDLGERVIYNGTELIITGMELTIEVEQIPEFFYILNQSVLAHECDLEPKGTIKGPGFNYEVKSEG